MRVSDFIRTKLRHYHRLVILVAVVATTGSVALNHTLIQQGSSLTAMISLTAQQSMLSQRIAFYQDRLVAEKGTKGHNSVKGELSKLTTEFEHNHWTIIGSVPTHDEAHPFSDAQQLNYFFAKPSLHQQSISFIAHSRRFIKDFSDVDGSPSVLPLATLQTLLTKLNKAVFQFEREAKDQASFLITVQWQIWIVAIILLLLVSIFLFKPMETLILRILKKYRLTSRSLEKKDLASEVKNQFLMNISHELRTPISGMFGMMELAAQEGDRDKQAKLLQKAQDSGYQLLSLVDNILDISRIEANELGLDSIDFELNTLLDNCLAPATAACYKNAVSFSFVATSPLPLMVKGDSARLSQAINYLLSNAIKFTPYGSIKTSAAITVRNKGYIFEFCVHDTGVGINEGDLARIFDKFTQLNSDESRIFKGAGLGLTIAKVLVEQMGGSIRVESTLGKSSQFTITLPLGKSEVQPPRLSPSAILQTTRFAVVDDLQTSRDYISMLLQSQGYLVDTFDSGADLLRNSANVEQYAAVIVDILMPGLSGYELAEMLHALHGESCPALVFVSASTESINKRKFDFIDKWQAFSKPINKDRFIDYMHLLASNNYQNYPSNRAINVLVVEDEPINAEVVLSMLNKMGHHTLHAASGEQAVAMATTEDIDLILMDIDLPDFSGIEATHKILKEHKIKVPIIALTANVYDHDKLLTKEAGMRYHLTKPVQFNELKDVIGTLNA